MVIVEAIPFAVEADTDGWARRVALLIFMVDFPSASFGVRRKVTSVVQGCATAEIVHNEGGKLET